MPTKVNRRAVSDPLATLETVDINGVVRRHKPTLMQQRFLQEYMKGGVTKREALRRAGYSKASARASTKAAYTALKNLSSVMVGKLKDRGIDEDAIADKFVEWLNSKKTLVNKQGQTLEIPDHDIQMKAYDRVNKILKIDEDSQTGKGKGVKRKMTIEEYVFGEQQQDEDGEVL